jgi:DNA-binding NtrC family response regulator
MTASVLIVDDDANIRATMETLLRTVLGVRVASVESARDALAWLGVHPANLVITDLYMPGMSGSCLVRAMREAGNLIPVIIISGYLRSFESESQWRELGVAAVLEKPFGMRELLDAVTPLLNLEGAVRVGG